ncbi:MAG TPA: transcription antitermination factor NusB, partial [Acidimicrobiales bacterium]|nr:transcription antitermination factor NusB [Acidimicrobiales bacterium]
TEGGERANIVLPRLLSSSGLDERDRAFATELTYGCLRMLRACDWLVGLFAKGDLDPEVRAAARCGAYQLVWMRAPAYAAVSATVAAAPARGRAVVNAVLRRVSEMVEQGPVRWPNPGVALSYPDWVIARLSRDLGPAKAAAALARMNEAPTVSVREDGYTQDPASQAVSRFVCEQLRPGSLVADVCAAPGGKATYVAGQGHRVVALDIAGQRAGLVAENAARTGLGPDQLAVAVADGLAPPLRHAAFDAVLVDAPCSGLGVLRRRPDARWRAQPGDIDRLAVLQRRLLRAAMALVAPGGALVYSVCTLTRAETLEMGEWLVQCSAELCAAAQDPRADQPALAKWDVLAPPGAPWERCGPGALLLPQAASTDGMFVVGLRRPRA